LDSAGAYSPSVTLLSGDVHPYGFTCPALSHFTDRLRAGDAFFFRPPASLVFPGAGIELDGSAAGLWAPPPLALARQAALAVSRSRAVLDWLERKPEAQVEPQVESQATPAGTRVESQIETQVEPCAESRAEAALCGFAERLAYRRIREVLAAWPPSGLGPGAWSDLLGGLVGLGPGLTPLGDDFISGFLTAAWHLAPHRRRPAILAVGRSLAAGDTTFFGRQQILFAAGGVCLGVFYRFMAALTVSEAEFYREAAQACLAVGASSGYGWVAGITAAISILAPDSI
jgi:hypothetical protein